LDILVVLAARSKCEYCSDNDVKYFDHAANTLVPFDCPHTPIANKKYCKFHDVEFVRKNPEEIEQSFHELVERASKNDGILYCVGFTFITVVKEKIENIKILHFEHAHFEKGVDFRDTNFCGRTYFNFANFKDKAVFDNAHFKKEVDFSNAKFTGKRASFNGAQFCGEAIFSLAQFYQVATFSGAQFQDQAVFNNTRFNGTTGFVTHFIIDVSFVQAHFYGITSIPATFEGVARFSQARFYGKTSFIRTQFNGKVVFDSAMFKNVDFFQVTFEEEADFFHVQFPLTEKKYLFDWEFITKEEGRFKLAEFLKKILKHKLSADGPSVQISDVKKNMTVSWIRGNILQSLLFTVNDEELRITFTGETYENSYKFEVRKNNDTLEIYDHDIIIPIRFSYSTFRKRARFVGDPNPKENVQLGWVSFVGVDLTHVEFANVKWRTKEEKMFYVANVSEREVTIDEEFLDRMKNYGEVSKVYNQLRKNYEIRLLFNEASNFFVGEMEAIRKYLLREKWKGFRWIPYMIYKWLALYGESIRLPLVIWTPAIIVFFIGLRWAWSICAIPHNCSPLDITIDSISAYFQFPRSVGLSNVAASNIDIVERIVSVPVLGTAFIVLRRRFERSK
jgi:uncharacterized protein YjbI with pentapeptide repeats